MAEIIHRASEQVTAYPSFSSQIARRLRDGGDKTINVHVDSTRHETLSRESSVRSGNPFGTTTGTLPKGEKALYRLVELAHPNNRKVLVASIDGTQSPIGTIAQRPLIGFVYRPSAQEGETDQYHLVFKRDRDDQEHIIDVETPHDHRFTEMNFRPMLTQILLKVSDSGNLETGEVSPVRVHDVVLQRQTTLSRNMLTSVLNNPNYKPLMVKPEDLGFNPLTMGGTGTAA